MVRVRVRVNDAIRVRVRVNDAIRVGVRSTIEARVRTVTLRLGHYWGHLLLHHTNIVRATIRVQVGVGVRLGSGAR